MVGELVGLDLAQARVLAVTGRHEQARDARAEVEVAAGPLERALEAAALADDKIKALLDGKSLKKVIAVPGKLVNVVV